MDSRERVLRCLNHEEPDRVPIDFWASSETWAKLFQRFGASEKEPILQRFDVDFRYIEGPSYVGAKLATHPDGSWEDHFGVARRKVQYGVRQKAGTYLELAGSPLAGATSLEEIEGYSKWPSPDDFDYECVREQARRARESGKIVDFMGDRLNGCAQLKPAMYLRGIEQILMDIAAEPGIAQAIFSRIASFYAEYARRTLEAGEGNIDIFFTGDDFGTQDNLFMAPELWRQMLRDGFKRFIDIGHAYGCKVAHHTCGSILKILPDRVECGLDILNPLQPDVVGMDYRSVKAIYGDRLCFHGAISIQKTLPYGTPQDVRAEVKDRAELLSPSGGYIFCSAHNIQADTPIENIEALMAAYRKYGWRPPKRTSNGETFITHLMEWTHPGFCSGGVQGKLHHSEGRDIPLGHCNQEATGRRYRRPPRPASKARASPLPRVLSRAVLPSAKPGFLSRLSEN